jgi:hypothetical protein
MFRGFRRAERPGHPMPYAHARDFRHLKRARLADVFGSGAVVDVHGGRDVFDR